MMCRMQVRLVLLIVMAGYVVSGPGRAQNKSVPLVPEVNTTLRVGEMALLSVPSDHRYDAYASSKAPINGAWRDVLEVVRHSKRKVMFRATHPGSGVLLLSPDVPNGECISCATIHYFVNVVPSDGSSQQH